MPDDRNRDDRRRIPRPEIRDPEWVGPDTRREDLTGVSDRKIVLRAVHEALMTRNEVALWSQQHDRLADRVVLQEEAHAQLADRVDALEAAVGGMPPMPAAGTPSGVTAGSAGSAGLPPPRPRFTSSHDVARAVGDEIADTIEAESLNPNTPTPPPLDKVRAISVDVVQVALDKLKALQWDRLEAERNATETERRANVSARNKAKWRLITMAIVSATAIITALAEHFSR